MSKIVSIARFDNKGEPWAEIECDFPEKGKKFIAFALNGGETDDELKLEAVRHARDCAIAWGLAP